MGISSSLYNRNHLLQSCSSHLLQRNHRAAFSARLQLPINSINNAKTIVSYERTIFLLEQKHIKLSNRTKKNSLAVLIEVWAFDSYSKHASFPIVLNKTQMEKNEPLISYKTYVEEAIDNIGSLGGFGRNIEGRPVGGTQLDNRHLKKISMRGYRMKQLYREKKQIIQTHFES